MKEKTDTKASFNSDTFDSKKETVKQKEVKKDIAPVEEAKPQEKPISEMTDAEIEAYMKKRKAEKDSFTIVNEDIPMCKLIRASVVPAPKLNEQEIMRSMMLRQNKLERTLVDKK